MDFEIQRERLAQFHRKLLTCLKTSKDILALQEIRLGEGWIGRGLDWERVGLGECWIRRGYWVKEELQGVFHT